jgi:hypothetical protein
MTEPAFPCDVFLSHSAKDKAVVRALAERLRKDGLKVWFDEWVLKPGDSIPAKIEAGLEHSRVLVLGIRRCRIRFYFRSGPALKFSDPWLDLARAPACAIPQARCFPSRERRGRTS